MKNDWEKKEKTCSAYLSSRIFATSARIWTRSTSLSSFQWSNWCPTYILHLFHLEDTPLLFIFLSESSKSAFFHALTLSLLPKNYMLFIVSKQCACSRRVHIEGHMNRFEFLLSWTIIPITIVLGLFCKKKSYLLQRNSVLIFIFMKVSTENDNNFGYENISILVNNMPLKCLGIYNTITTSRSLKLHWYIPYD